MFSVKHNYSVSEVELSCYEENDDKERFNNLVLGSLVNQFLFWKYFQIAFKLK